MEQYSGTLLYQSSKAIHRQRHSPRTQFSRLVPPENSCFFNWSKPFVQLETTRGCFNTCAFCVSGGEKPVRTLSIESIRERLQIIHSHGIKTYASSTVPLIIIRAVLKNYCNFSWNSTRTYVFIWRYILHYYPKSWKWIEKLPQGLLHLEAGIQSLREPVLQKSRRMGSLEDSLQGLRFLCSLPNMETHADLIAGLPLYRLSEIFEDVRTLAGYNAGEIQLESLKLLPGTEMRRRAEELGIRYSPLPLMKYFKQMKSVSTNFKQPGNCHVFWTDSTTQLLGKPSPASWFWMTTTSYAAFWNFNR